MKVWSLACAGVALLWSSTAFAGEPEPEDDHVRPPEHELGGAALELTPPPQQAPAEYPLAVTFNPAHDSNYVANGMYGYDYIVVHTIQGSYEGAQSWFQNPSANVSAHFIANSDDGEITQMVELADRAWHVGEWNGYSIGIEHEGWVDEPAWYTWTMYSSSATLARWLADELVVPIDREHIVGHVELPGQTHTDPGIHWNWDLYMALVADTVSGGEIHGFAVDEGSLCTLTATSDTWLKATLQASTDLADGDKCWIPAGTELTYRHASPELYGHHRVYFEAEGSPCEGLAALDGEGFVFADHVSEPCADATKAAAGVTVTLDGGASVVTGPDGGFSFTNVSAGPHTLDVAGGEDYLDTMVPVDIDVFPGTRVVFGLEPTDGGDSGGFGSSGEGGEGGDDGECWVGAEGCACTMGGGCDPGLTCEASTWTCVPEEDGETGLSGGIDYVAGQNCAVDPDQRRGPLGLLALGLLVLGMVGGRRRSLTT